LTDDYVDCLLYFLEILQISAADKELAPGVWQYECDHMGEFEEEEEQMDMEPAEDVRVSGGDVWQC
jgi:hypothetical protein